MILILNKKLGQNRKIKILYICEHFYQRMELFYENMHHECLQHLYGKIYQQVHTYIIYYCYILLHGFTMTSLPTSLYVWHFKDIYNSQCIHISNHHVEYLNYMQTLFVNYTFIKLGGDDRYR